jgi:micrococcal nuclease
MSTRDKRALVAALIVLISALFTYFGTPPTAHAPEKSGTQSANIESGTLYPVVHIADGDTIDVMKDAHKVRVRLIGINAPESVDPRRPVQCYGVEASQELKRVLTGQSVSLETDPSQDTYDKYGRLLAYVFTASSTNVGEHMIAQGFAYEYTYNLPYKYQRAFRAAQAAAEREGRGLWAAGVCGR